MDKLHKEIRNAQIISMILSVIAMVFVHLLEFTLLQLEEYLSEQFA